MDSETKKMLEEILTIVRGIDAGIARLDASAIGSSSRTSKSTSAEKKLSLKEFIIDRAPTNAVQTALTIAHYLEIHDGVSPFNAADLEQGFRAAREMVPPNINDKANMCVKNGYFMEEKAKKNNTKAWVVTRTGEEIVRNGFRKISS